MRSIAPRRSKYGATRCVVDGNTFDSQREARRYAELRLLERAGEITELRRQVSFVLKAGETSIKFPSGRAARYVADFTYLDASGALVIEDAKGFATPEFKLKAAIMAAMGYRIIQV